MYNLNIHIESEDLLRLSEIQQSLSTVFNSDDKVWRVSFNHKKYLYHLQTYEQQRGGAGRDDYTAPPPAPEYNGLTDLQREAFSNILESENYIDELKSELRKYILDWDDYKKTRNRDFIDEEEMKL